MKTIEAVNLIIEDTRIRLNRGHEKVGTALNGTCHKLLGMSRRVQMPNDKLSQGMTQQGIAEWKQVGNVAIDILEGTTRFPEIGNVREYAISQLS